MSTLISAQSALEIRIFLDGFDSITARRGVAYFNEGAVLKLEQLEDPYSYVAVVRGGEDYELSIYYGEEGWEGACSCPMGYECKHIYAATLALRTQLAQSVAVPVGKSKSRSNVVKLPAAPAPPAAPEPPASPLLARLIKMLGRLPNTKEQPYLRAVQALFKAVREQQRSITPYDFRLLSADFKEYGWEPLDLWPKLPQDEYEFWLYCAWELRRRGLDLPNFMERITDFSVIEPRMKAWERKKDIARWNAQFAEVQFQGTGQVATEPSDLRLVLHRDRATLQWRARAAESFKDVTQSVARRLMRAHEEGSLALLPEAWSLWMAVYKPYDFHTWTHLDYDNPEILKLLNRVLRLPAMSERIVTEQGLPFARPADPLRFELREAENDESDYGLRLARADGSVPSPIRLALSGHPPLYVTAEEICTGPPPHSLGNGADLMIPAPALESGPGLGFILGLGVELPPRLLARTRRVTVKVKVFCDLKPLYPGSATESVAIRILAELDGDESQQFTANGWAKNPQAPAAKGKAPKDGLVPVLDRSAQQHFPRLVEALGAKWEAYQQNWKVKLTRSFPETFVPWLASLPPGVEVHLDRELATFQNAPMAGSIRLDVEEAGVDWFDLKVVLDLADTELTPEELKLLLNARGGYVRLGKKGWRRLQFQLTADEDERLARLGLDARDFSAEPQRLHALQLADEAASTLLPEEQVLKIQRRAGELKARVAPALPEGIRATLRPYQLEGFHFLAYLTANRFGGVLADDMGLGKTLQALTWLAWLRAEFRGTKALKTCLPSLVVCPKSVMDNWRSEAGQFLPGLRVRLWRGEDATALAEARGDSDLIVVNYSQLRSLSPEIAKMRWHTAILDEAQYIKNPDSQTAQVARALAAEHRLALTGTPIENRLLDLWSILAYAMPGVLGNRAQFTKKFDAQDDPLARRRLAARVRPFLLRRTKNQVARDLPDRIEEDLLCELEGEQRLLYRAEFKRAQQMLLKVQTRQELNENRFNFLTSLLRLRQICCHPALVNGTLRKAESAKLNALIDLLEPLMEEGHKVLVFSQFVTMLDLLRETVQERNWQHFYLAGETENRGALVQEFQEAKGSAVFLISLKAGGFGLNLTAASYVVLFDPWWNPAVESQAIDRTHRIGQKNKVIAYRLLMKDSIEEKIRKLQKTKAALADDVLGEETFAKSLTLEDLRFLFAEE